MKKPYEDSGLETKDAEEFENYTLEYAAEPMIILLGLTSFGELGKKYLNNEDFKKYIEGSMSDFGIYWDYFTKYKEGKLDTYFSSDEVYNVRKKELTEIQVECKKLYYKHLFKHTQKDWLQLFLPKKDSTK